MILCELFVRDQRLVALNIESIEIYFEMDCFYYYYYI